MKKIELLLLLLIIGITGCSNVTDDYTEILNTAKDRTPYVLNYQAIVTEDDEVITLTSEIIYNSEGDIKIYRPEKEINESYYKISGVSYICYEDSKSCELSEDKFTIEDANREFANTVPDLKDIEYEIIEGRIVSDSHFDEASYKATKDTISFQITRSSEEYVGKLTLIDQAVELPY